MRDLFVLMLVLVGVAVALLVVFTPFQPQEGPPSDETSSTRVGERHESLIPQEIPGFKRLSLERAEPSLPGEVFSVHARFAPASESSFAGRVESLGISVFRLEDAQAAGELRPLLLLGEPESVAVEGEEMEFFLNEQAAMAGLVWQRGVDLYYILASGAGGDGFEGSALREAVLAAGGALIEGE